MRCNPSVGKQSAKLPLNGSTPLQRSIRRPSHVLCGGLSLCENAGARGIFWKFSEIHYIFLKAFLSVNNNLFIVGEEIYTMFVFNKNAKVEAGTGISVYYIFGAFNVEKNAAGFSMVAIEPGTTQTITNVVTGKPQKLSQTAIMNGMLAAIENASALGKNNVLICHQLRDFEQIMNANEDVLGQQIRVAIPETMRVSFQYVEDDALPKEAADAIAAAKKAVNELGDDKNLSPRCVRREKIDRLAASLAKLQKIEDEITMSDSILQKLDSNKCVDITENEYGVICRAVTEYRNRQDALMAPIE